MFVEGTPAEEGNTARPHIERTTSFGRHGVSALGFGFFLHHGFLG